MKVIRDLESWRLYRQSISHKDSVGFVPTMGCLHSGHASLLQRSKQDNAVTILSIFVNPTQFNNPSDYARYPKTEETDLALAESLGVNAVWIPDVATMYPDEHRILCSTQHPISTIMEGQYRPGHYDGVLTIVLKLFLLVQPQRAYFGEKDYQQCCMVESLIHNFLLPITLIRCPTIRENQDLAMSSRNTLLNPKEREQAYYFAKIFKDTTAESIPESIAMLEASGISVEYMQVYQDRILTAVQLGSVRLIDNRCFNTHECLID